MNHDHPLVPLAAYRQFVTVKLIPLPNGKTDKLPVSPFGQVGIDAHDPANWQSWADAAALAQGLGSNHTVGFVLTDTDPFFCCDLDGVLMPDGTWSPLSQQFVAALPGCAVEISQSGRGLHIWGAGPVPEHTKKNVALGAEFYSSKRFIALGHSQVGQIVYPNQHAAAFCARFFPPKAAAGDIPDDGPRADWVGPADDDELIQRALGSRSTASVFGGKASFADLWNGNVDVLARSYPKPEGGYDESSADAALAQHLAFWTGCDVARMERLMRRSALVREKWDARADYLVERTIMGACGQCHEVYRDPKASQVQVMQAALAGGPAPGVPAVADSLPNMRNTIGIMSTTVGVALDTVQRAVRDELRLRIALDEFTERKTLQDLSLPGAVPRPIEPHDAIEIRMRIGLGGAKAVKADMMRDVIEMEAQANRYDSAAQWGQSLTWDGVPRIDRFLPQYLRAADTPYTRAVGAYWLTAAAGRVLRPGLQADMVPVLVGSQGVGKSTALRALCPSPDYFVSLDLSERDADLCRMMAGKLVIELSELAGLKKRDREAVKALITRLDDEWVPKYMENPRKHRRRFVFAGTTNEGEFLDDPSGERRWLPFEVGLIDVAAIQRDRDQLWAEGLARFQANGVEWQEAQRLAQAEHQRYAVHDEWTELVSAYLATTAGRPVAIGALYMHVLKRVETAVTREEQQRIARIMRSLGYGKRDCRHLGLTGKPYVRIAK